MLCIEPAHLHSLSLKSQKQSSFIEKEVESQTDRMKLSRLVEAEPVVDGGRGESSDSTLGSWSDSVMKLLLESQ